MRDKLIKVAALYEIPATVKSEGKVVDRKPLDVWDDLDEKLQHEVFSWLEDLDQMKNVVSVEENRGRWAQMKPHSYCTGQVNRLYRYDWETYRTGGEGCV